MAHVALAWNPVTDVRELLAYRFMVNALRAGTIVAILSGAIGWFMTLRRQTFAGHTLAVVAFPGATGAVLLGVGAIWGYFTFALAAALVIAAVPREQHAHRSSEATALIGTVQATALGAGVLFANLYHGYAAGVTARLFGTIVGVTDHAVLSLLAVAAVALVGLAAIARRLLFATLDPAVASARGLRVRALSAGFLVLLGLAAAEASQITGSLLVFALLVIPPATAQLFALRSAASITLSIALALAATWLGMATSYFRNGPVGFSVTTFAFGGYVIALALRAMLGGPLRRSPAARAPAAGAPAARAPAAGAPA